MKTILTLFAIGSILFLIGAVTDNLNIHAVAGSIWLCSVVAMLVAVIREG